MQYFPRAEKVRDFARYLVAMRQIAEARKVPIVQRFAIMKHLVTSAQFTARQLLASDLFHPNDVTYGCLGRLMADALQDEVARGDGAREVSGRACQAGRRRWQPPGALALAGKHRPTPRPCLRQRAASLTAAVAPTHLLTPARFLPRALEHGRPLPLA